MPSELTYNFVTNEENIECTYAEYLEMEDLGKIIRNKSRARLILGRTIISYDRRWLNETAHQQVKRKFETIRKEQEANPLRFFLPACAMGGFDSVAHQFINNVEDDINLLLGPNRFGKTTLLYLKMMTVRGLIRCDPTWEIFKDHGVRFTEFNGEKDMGIATFQQKNLSRTIWPQIVRAWTPEEELGSYGRVGRKSPDMKTDPKVRMYKSNSMLYMMTYEMKRAVFESQALDGMGWDESPPFWGFDGVETRMATTRTDHYEDLKRIIDGGSHDIAVTPMVIEDAEYETGAGTWLEDLAEGREDYGLKVKVYNGNLGEVPDWIYPEATKIQKHKMWIERPKERIAAGDKTAERDLERGMARYYGIFEKRGGRVYPEWDQDIHMVDPFEIPSSWTFYRGLDHGRSHPTACIVAACDDHDNIFVVRSMIMVDKNVTDLVQEIIEGVGNRRERSQVASSVNRYRESYKEVMCTRSIRWTKMDPRAFSKRSDENNETLGAVFKRYGLHVTKAYGGANKYHFPMVAQMLQTDDNHVFPDKHKKAGEKGAPRLYVLNTMENQKNFVEKIEKYQRKIIRSGITDDAKAGEDDMMDALKYLVSGKPRYVAYYGAIAGQGENNGRPQQIHRRRDRNSISAY